MGAIVLSRKLKYKLKYWSVFGRFPAKLDPKTPKRMHLLACSWGLLEILAGLLQLCLDLFDRKQDARLDGCHASTVAGRTHKLALVPTCRHGTRQTHETRNERLEAVRGLQNRTKLLGPVWTRALRTTKGPRQDADLGLTWRRVCRN